ncbi:MAG: hypothetical protein MZV64_34675 [Ignavibacteriales bacterium]|nr:hypothetical protein [Ignavibacteriales bacterium]
MRSAPRRLHRGGGIVCNPVTGATEAACLITANQFPGGVGGSGSVTAYPVSNSSLTDSIALDITNDDSVVSRAINGAPASVSEGGAITWTVSGPGTTFSSTTTPSTAPLPTIAPALPVRPSPVRSPAPRAAPHHQRPAGHRCHRDRRQQRLHHQRGRDPQRPAGHDQWRHSDFRLRRQLLRPQHPKTATPPWLTRPVAAPSPAPSTPRPTAPAPTPCPPTAARATALPLTLARSRST